MIKQCYCRVKSLNSLPNLKSPTPNLAPNEYKFIKTNCWWRERIKKAHVHFSSNRFHSPDIPVAINLRMYCGKSFQSFQARENCRNKELKKKACANIVNFSIRVSSFPLFYFFDFLLEVEEKVRMCTSNFLPQTLKGTSRGAFE